jgi:hypothetical protein
VGGRIFISHSSNHDKFAAEVRDAVEQELAGLGHQPLIDKTLIDPGDRWRAKVLRWVGTCHGAVLLLTQRAADRDWVRAEATIIGWRAWLNTSMRVVPVLLDEGASSSYLDELGLTPVQLRNIQTLGSADVQGDGASAWGSAIAQCFAGFSAGPVREDPMALWVKQVGSYLRSNGFLEEAADALQIPEDERIDIESSLYELVAHRLLHSNARLIEGAVLALANDAQLKRDIRTFAPLVSCAWLPAGMAPRLFRVAGGEGSPRVAAVCVGIPTTAARLLKRLTCCDNRYVVIEPISFAGTGGNEKAELRDRYFRAILAGVGADSLQRFEAAMESLEAARPNRPVFVILGEDALDAGILDDLTASFAGVVFLCAANADALASSVLDVAAPVAVELTPRLVERDEAAGSSMAERLEQVS